MRYLGILDFIWVPTLLMLVLWRARKTQSDNEGNLTYTYYSKALLVKVFGGLVFALLYAFYYGGGDTINYWMDSSALSSLIFRNPICYLDVMMDNRTIQNFRCFDLTKFIPYYYFRDPQAYTVVRLTSPVYFLTINSFLGCTMIVSIIAFGGIWRLYSVFCEEYPMLYKEFAISFFFIPSVVFWGSGIMKDTYTFTAVCWFVSSVYGVLLKRRNIVSNVFYIVVASYIMISMKAYIFVALLPGALLWTVFNQINEVENKVVRMLAAPVLIMVSIVGAALVFSQASSSLGEYGSVDSILEKAVVTQEDLKRDAYGGNTFDIGSFEPTIPGVLSKMPVAIFAGLFRPTLLDTKNIVMVISALENTALMIFLIYVLFQVKFIGFFRYAFSKPMILFAVIFSLFFSFAVGLTTSNFGSLVRYKIPALPFFLASLYMIMYEWNNKSADES
ncbi:hypothetical protein ACFLR1_06355 [Bacteroidota bacterium]